MEYSLKIDRFLFCENPQNIKSNKGYILHTIKPKCLIEAVDVCTYPDVVSSGLPHMVIEYINGDLLPEKWVLSVRDIYDGSSNDDVLKLLSRAARWFKAYLAWEDGNIDSESKASLN